MLAILSMVCAGGATVDGIDVDQFAGTVDWAMVKASGKSFAYASIGNGSAADLQFPTSWPAMQAAGLVRGGYLVFRPMADPHEEATLVIQSVGQLGDGDLPVALDVAITDGQTPAVIVTNIMTVASLIAAGTGKPPILFTTHGFWDTFVMSTALQTTPLWVGDHAVTCPDLPAAWTGWNVWQDSNTGTVGGATGTVDTDTFNGSDGDLIAFASGPVNAPDDLPLADGPPNTNADAGLPTGKSGGGCCDAGGSPAAPIGAAIVVALSWLRRSSPRRPRRR